MLVALAGALPFFRDPFAREIEPMQELILLGMGQQLERQFCALSALSCLAVILMHLPLRLTKLLAPKILPLQLSLTTPLGDSNLLFFNFLLPLIISRLKVRYSLCLSAIGSDHPNPGTAYPCSGLC